ncbi:MAG: zf-HC2 domain-containing protein [Sphingobacteriales bacterium]|nr:zf-HC2 domain-containing protein [Sphingobacteriales bacterium]
MNHIEERIWDYIDGLCSEEEQEAISHLIIHDPVYSLKYQELMALQKDFQLLELDEPSMAFTYKVMEKVALQSKPLSAKALIDKRIIYGISAIFVVLLLICLVIAVKDINWAASFNTPAPINFNLRQLGSQVKLSEANKTFILYGFFMFDIIAALMLFDKFLRRKLA